MAVAALRSTGDHVTLVVLPAAGSIPPVARTAPLYSSKYFENSYLNNVMLRTLSYRVSLYHNIDKHTFVTYIYIGQYRS